jgi:hypothetical protein
VCGHIGPVHHAVEYRGIEVEGESLKAVPTRSSSCMKPSPPEPVIWAPTRMVPQSSPTTLIVSERRSLCGSGQRAFTGGVGRIQAELKFFVRASKTLVATPLPATSAVVPLTCWDPVKPVADTKGGTGTALVCGPSAHHEEIA